MKSIVLAIALSCLAGPSLALSCIAPDVASTFNEAAASDKSYIVVHGTITFDEEKLPKVDMNQQEQAPQHVDIEAQLSGKSLSMSGFETPFDRLVTLRSICFGPWCGQAVSKTDYLSFLEKTDKGYVLSVTPCGGYEFPNPTDQMLDEVAQCLRDGRCTQ